MRKVGGLARYSRQAKLAQLWKVEYARTFLGNTQRLYRNIADDVMSRYTYGATPRYEALHRKTAPDDGYTRDARDTLVVIDSAWGDIIQLKALAWETKALIYPDLLEYSRTTDAPKRLPGRAFCEKFRAISDVRRAHIGKKSRPICPPHIWSPEVNNIAERVVEKTTVPWIDR